MRTLTELGESGQSENSSREVGNGKEGENGASGAEAGTGGETKSNEYTGDAGRVAGDEREDSAREGVGDGVGDVDIHSTDIVLRNVRVECPTNGQVVLDTPLSLRLRPGEHR